MSSIVYLNGCFDPIHEGHRYFFWKAKQLEDLLYVGIMPDIYIRRAKNREPVSDEISRAAAIAALDSVDKSIILPDDEIGEIEMIIDIRPDTVCFGPGQYAKEWNLQLRSILKSHDPNIRFVDIPGYHREVYQSSLLR